MPKRPPRITKREVAGLILLGGSLTSVGIALYEVHRFDSLRQTITAKAPGSDLESLEDQKAAAAVRAKVFLAIGGAALITGGALYVTGYRARKRAERAYVAPSLMKNGAGLVLGGKF